MFCSLKLGIAALAESCDRAFVFPADLPLVRPETLRQLMACSAPLVSPAMRREGHPILISRELFGAIEQYSGEGGLRELLGGLDADVRVVPVEDRGVLLDVNSYEEYEQVLAMEAQRCGRGKLRRVRHTALGGRRHNEPGDHAAPGDGAVHRLPAASELMNVLTPAAGGR
ncbi:MAG: NTP transferase domain-containing protein [Oscillospiraceae bacterium]